METGFGVVGLGMGRARARLVTKTPGAKLVAVCDINQERLSKAQTEFGCKTYSNYEDMLKDKEIDVVYVMTPSGTHLDFGKKAAEAGKHVITTKPMETTVSKCKKFIEVCEKNNVILVVDFELRYQKQNQQIKAALDSGELGEIVFAEARCKWWRTQEYYDAGNWRGTWKFDGGGSAANQGIHIIDMLVWFCGSPIEVISSIYGVYGHKIETEDLTVSLLKLKNGNPGCIVTTTNHHLGDEFGVSLSCKNGSFSNLRGELKIKMADGSETLKTQPPQLPQNAVEDMLWALKGNNPYVSGYEGIRSIELLEQIYKKGKKFLKK